MPWLLTSPGHNQGSHLLCRINASLSSTREALTHWGQVIHICISNLDIIGSDNGLSPVRCQAIIWTNAAILSIRPYGTYFSEISFTIQKFSFKELQLKLSSVKWRPFCLCLNVLNSMCNLIVDFFIRKSGPCFNIATVFACMGIPCTRFACTVIQYCI